MNTENVKSKQTRKKFDTTWAEAAKIVLEKHPQTPMSYKEILKEIQECNLKDASEAVPVACLNSCLHANARGPSNIFYKVAGHIGMYGLMSDLPGGSEIIEIEEDTGVSVGGLGNTVGDGPLNNTKQKVIYAKIPDTVKTIPPLGTGVEQNGVPIPSVISIPTSNIQMPKVDTPTRRSVRQAQRKKRKHGFIPKITIKPIVPPKHEGKSSGGATQVRYVATTSRPVTKIQLNNHKDSSSVKVSVDGTQTGLRRPASQTGAITNGEPRKKTLREMLAGIPGFSMKPRKRTNKKLSHAAQIAQTMEGCIDLETPDSILVNTNLKGLLTKHTFSSLPANYQYKLITLLPECDRIVGKDSALRLSSTALNNEFFAKACTEWRERLSEAEFTPENQQRLKQEEEKEQFKLDPWKAKHFEPVWGQKCISDVPKADDIHQSSSGDSPTVTSHHPVRVSSVKKPTLVSTMLKQRSIHQNVQGYSSASHLGNRTETGLLMKLQTSKSQNNISEQGIVQSSAVKRPVVNQEGDCSSSISPPKRQKVVLTQKQILAQAQAKTLAQIRAQTQVARMQKSEGKMIGKVTSSYIPSVVSQTISPGTEPHTKPIVVNVSTPVSGSGLRSPTRTLAQIKSQTQAAKAKVQGQTRTLAQIKAETKAHVHNVHQQQVEAQAKLHAHLLAKARGGHSPNAQTIVRPLQSIVVPTQGRPKQTKVLESEKTADGVNLKRSFEICEQAKIMSQKYSVLPTVSLLQKPQVQTVVKSTVSSAKPSVSDSLFGSYLKADIAQAHKTVSQILQDKTLAEQKIQKFTQAVTNARIKSENVTQPKFVGVSAPVIKIPPTSVQNVPIPSNVPTSTLNSSNVSFVVLPPPTVTQVTGISPAVFSVPSTRYVISSTAAAAQQNLLQQLIRSAAGSQTNVLSQQRAASAPPQQKVVTRVATPVTTLVRSASVGTSAGSLEEMDNVRGNVPQKTSVPSDIIVQIPSEQVNFLAKAGTALIPGVNGSKSGSQQIFLSSSGSQVVISPSGGVIHTPGFNGSSAQTVTVIPAVTVDKKGNQMGNQSAKENVLVVSPEQPPNGSLKSTTVQSSNTVTLQVSKSETSQSNCSCTLKGMKTCTKCGAFCHDDCIGPSKLCVTCLIAT
ncbi:polycomb protein Asx-like isoform X2 [Mercenaria mercenaria]|uniref:polycomb protein Asx-like isoform X2 n=1 Tax=Mercenaria mercenaria TaxID=6596 RepID=UPI00234E9991|nr:polycomb protein Asx-like isoform X2 [Mercenaria mercenaria]